MACDASPYELEAVLKTGGRISVGLQGGCSETSKKSCFRVAAEHASWYCAHESLGEKHGLVARNRRKHREKGPSLSALSRDKARTTTCKAASLGVCKEPMVEDPH